LYREVNTLSRLNHRFIVRYYTTWIEYSDIESTTSSTIGSSAGTATDQSAGTSTPGGYSVATSFDEDDPLAINWSKVKSPSNGHSFPSIHFTTNDASDSDESDNGGSGTAGSLGDEMQRAVTPANGVFDMDDMFTPMPKLSKIMFIQMVTLFFFLRAFIFIS
jgi:eukaryotic translation initiation factor 2-alpha kinase 4